MLFLTNLKSDIKYDLDGISRAGVVGAGFYLVKFRKRKKLEITRIKICNNIFDTINFKVVLDSISLETPFKTKQEFKKKRK